ncbi:MAG: hypothetical protein IJB30_02095 [Clostridia bacterium]|nr:hypothetical protein [Clostridia bacterium]MBQ4610503.1 hypothetical protein [Clostridia bacterium]
MKPLKLYMEGDKVICAFTLHIDVGWGEAELMTDIIRRGLSRMEGVYQTSGGPVEIEVRAELAERFSLGAVNVRVENKTPVIRKWYSPRMNVSRAYIGARRKGLMKLTRYLWRMPDVFINIAGRDMEIPRNQAILACIVQHEFGHVLGFRDKYRYKKHRFIKSKSSVVDRDIMYRIGEAQGFMEYHIKRLKECASKGKLPFRSV